MSEYCAPVDELMFLLRFVFPLDKHCETLVDTEFMDLETCAAILAEAAKTCEQVLAPLDAAGDSQGCRFEQGRVSAPDGFKDAYQVWVGAGWNALGGPEQYGGTGAPKLLAAAVEEMLQASNMALGLAPMLTAGACLALNCHASDELKQQYLPKLYSGRWAGAMDLTEAHAGSDLGLMRAKAEANADGSYQIYGSKIFITWGEHDLCENIVHLVLAKLPGAAPGSRGISMFLVPKFLPGDGDQLGAQNKLSCGSIESKMGIHASPTCVMNFDGATGWLIGEAHQGLACMFTMMNYERLVVAIQALGVADKSYQVARDYALERLQGRAPSGAVAPELAADPLIVHPDVRRMLLEMRALNEAGRAFYLYVAHYLDLWRCAKDAQQRALAGQRVALLTPIAKAFISDRSFDACVLGQQVLGGHGYCAEWGQEQRVRDVRITQIYEGSNGIQALDLMLRKVLADDGEALLLWLSELENDAAQSIYKAELSAALDEVKVSLSQVLTSESKVAVAAAASDFLAMLGYLAYAHMWVLMLKGAELTGCLQSKSAVAAFFFAKLMPRVKAHSASIQAGAETLLNLDANDF
ncbi:acyl-CoA dehydrogenase family protein [Agaribacterium haliotis]|uniref:acyl-CoA dehydrogenase family protein n=1 Tax=Agaribacterium haliotis TaxID=2013869 RepID=UPI000BB54324|nr:acyl-CoA dehydrogenase family protein [Agaribacterium haliotis]